MNNDAKSAILPRNSLFFIPHGVLLTKMKPKIEIWLAESREREQIRPRHASS